MGIDWENILGTEHNLQDVYDNMVFDSDETHNFGLDSEIPEGFDGSEWLHCVLGKKVPKGYNEYIRGKYYGETFADFLRRSEQLPKSIFGKVCLFLMSGIVNAIREADESLSRSGSGCSLGEFDLSCANEGDDKDTTFEAVLNKNAKAMKSGTDRKTVDLIFDTLEKFIEPHTWNRNSYYDLLVDMGIFLIEWQDDEYDYDDMTLLLRIFNDCDENAIDWDYFDSRVLTSRVFK